MKTIHFLCLALHLSLGGGYGTQNCQGSQCNQNNAGGPIGGGGVGSGTQTCQGGQCNHSNGESGPKCKRETKKKCSQVLKDGKGTTSMECVDVEENVCQVCSTVMQEECKMVEEPTQIQTLETVCQARPVCTFFNDLLPFHVLRLRQPLGSFIQYCFKIFRSSGSELGGLELNLPTTILGIRYLAAIQ